MKRERAVLESITVLRALPAGMRLDGWVKAGTTSDCSMLREIKRDYEAKGLTVAFSRGAMDDVHYWTRVKV